MIAKQWEAFPVADRVMLNLVCKRFAQEMPVFRRMIPRLSASITNSTLAASGTAPKRARINFLQRLSPWFNDNTALYNPDIVVIEKARKQGVWGNVFSLVPVDDGWLFCVACLKWYRGCTILININDVPTKSDDPKLPGVWTRCVVPHHDEPLLHSFRESVDLTGIEQDWLRLPATANSTVLPGYYNPKTAIKKLQKKIDTPADKGKGKAKVKVDAPQSINDVDQSAKKGKGAKDPATWTGFEGCAYLPVDLKGERVAEFLCCPIHTFDPVKFVGL
jgi:hypothetical protein